MTDLDSAALEHLRAARKAAHDLSVALGDWMDRPGPEHANHVRLAASTLAVEWPTVRALVDGVAPPTAH